MSRLTSNHFIEGVMAWKYSQGLTDGMDYLVQYYSLRGFTKNDVVISTINTNNFYPTLLAQLSQDCAVFPPSYQLQVYGSEPTNRIESPIRILFRKTAYLAYQLIRPWRGCFHSHLELEAIFWAQYRHLLV
ncbi:hypothetical protein BO82DRAFT_275431 [Aspergillus uvarum CBS 121591]|uniref:Uncharacterized protein n=1 Tax=Aspergillus uvarum CBS 121591 TaxID=1448315 RepID=A0A319CMG7_9EURO|nr:hypothetical protein BO82DRAFT_275431 [Aspergillus uvarum CBS 121591]PYH85241.1 hypothetical protein BO82DRAFT_275431 [Aspergillus uvarum CBS 121591]